MGTLTLLKFYFTMKVAAVFLSLAATVNAMSAERHGQFHSILMDMQNEVFEEMQSTSNPQALEIIEFIIEDLKKIDQFHHNFELMTHGGTNNHEKRSVWGMIQ